MRDTHLPLLLTALLIVTGAVSCGKPKDAPQTEEPSSNPQPSISESSTTPSDSSPDPHTDQTTEQTPSDPAPEREASFKVGGMVTRFGMV